jgi:hypothetical protein
MDSENKEKQDVLEIDPLLVMEDILDKLKILDYEAQFTRIKYYIYYINN